MTSIPQPTTLSSLATVRVGTLSRPKIEAVRLALEPYAKNFEVHGHGVASEVSEQPVGFAEIVRGARSRARAAYGTGPCDLAVGIEDGLVELSELGGEVLNVGAAVVTDGNREGLGFSSLFAYPPACVVPALESREPIGELFDALWNAHSRAEISPEPSGRSVGNIGLLTFGVLPRSEYGRHAVVCALIHLLHPEIYPPSRFSGEPLTASPLNKASQRTSGKVFNE